MAVVARAAVLVGATLAVVLAASCAGRSSLRVGRGAGGASEGGQGGAAGASEGGQGGGKPCSTTADCDDGDLCTVDACAPEGCTHASATCDDGLFCTADTCDPAAGCAHVLSDAACDDAVACTADACDPTIDACVHAPQDALCDDAVGCTVDHCGPTGCQHVPDASACDDGLLCTVDACQPSGCVHQSSNKPCDDGIACTIDSCDAQSDSCEHAACDGSCDNGVFCDGVERCDAAFGCVAGPPACELDLGCGFDGCTEASQGCWHSLPPGCAPAGHLLVARADGALVSVAPYSGVVTPVAPSNGTAHLDIAILAGRWFAVDWNGLVEFVPGTNTIKKTFGAVGNSNSLAAGPDGKLYAAAHAVYRVDPDTGVVETIGALPPGHDSSGDIAFWNGRMFVSTDAACGGALVEFDPATGVGTVLGGDGLGCVYGLGVVGGTLFTVNCDGTVGTFDPDTGVARVLSVANTTVYGAEATP